MEKIMSEQDRVKVNGGGLTSWLIENSKSTLDDRTIQPVMYLLKNRLNDMGADVYTIVPANPKIERFKHEEVKWEFKDNFPAGPYEKEVQSTVEALTFPGAIEVEKTNGGFVNTYIPTSLNRPYAKDSARKLADSIGKDNYDKLFNYMKQYTSLEMRPLIDLAKREKITELGNVNTSKDSLNRPL